ncbi:helix-turn-helix domain-containing protein [Eubacteriaceae bacterium Marseille-Q4139]|nr:helix-turn-helix domain-containing protein [Eubacteriaceae bacterium Marseille-Q4139]
MEEEGGFLCLAELEPEAVNTVLQHYRRLICYFSLVDGRADRDTEDCTTKKPLTAIFKYGFGR